MEGQKPPMGPDQDSHADSPDALFDALRDHPEWSDQERDAALDALVARFAPERLIAALQPRLRNLGGGDGEALLRLVEANASPELLGALARALAAQPNLPPERTWEALAVLDACGALEGHPELLERWNDLGETLDDEESSLAELADQLEQDPGEPWVALQGLGTVEPEIRASIVEGLATLPLGPGLVEFLRLLAYASDRLTRAAALRALDRPPPERDDPRLAAAWSSIARDHPIAEVAARAREWVGTGTALALPGSALPVPLAPLVAQSLVTALNGEGQGSVVLATRRGVSLTTAVFLCDVRRGVLDVYGQLDGAESAHTALFAEVAGQDGLDTLEDAHELALGLLSGGLLLSQETAPPALRYWLERTVGPSFQPRPLPPPFAGWDPSTIAPSALPSRVEALLDACPTWLDRSPLAVSMAEELLLRNGMAAPDPERDAGAYRYLFEHRLAGQLELYRRLLLGMASFWQAAGETDLGQTALALAWQLSDPQHAVPSHPFHVALTTRSLAVCQENVRGAS
jgi:hypothetical protein